MKLVLTLSLLFLSGCGMFTTGEGTFNGRVIEVTWEGRIFKSCEVAFQHGEQSSSRWLASTPNPIFCSQLADSIGQVRTVKYKRWARPCCLRMDTNDEIVDMR